MKTLRTEVAGMGDLVTGRLSLALDALDGDETAAHRVVDGDDAVNQTYVALENRCLDLFALQQPVASDLRIVAASFKIITDLERIGDLASNLGTYALTEQRSSVPEVDVVALAEDVQAMVEDGMTAYAERDVEACYELADRDDRVDANGLRASEQLVRALIEREHVTDAWSVERVLDDVSRLLLTVRDLERIGDHAVNIAARTAYMVENDRTLIY
ncbi:phosphate transport system protein [Haloarchaeobius iranensis]|uniref:Phosphate-specific transport system accessory protein PhoU n=2 Tax=Haloarchaeobius iranensis TaxID=996166 RepID=A0A1G9W043_9EURY|nr:phosphate transport system protein [Haloarchaeobius iranensis]